MNTFENLNAINVNGHTESKNGLTYLSWAWAWAEVKKQYPDATYSIKHFGDANLPYVYDPNTGYMVFTDVTIEGLTHEMWLPVMDNNNRAMKNEPYEIKTKYNTIRVAAATMFDVNKAVMRCLVKNLAMFGLGLYIYAGEDLPESASDEPAAIPTVEEKPVEPVSVCTCASCRNTVKPAKGKTVEQLLKWSNDNYGVDLCADCISKIVKESKSNEKH